MNPSERFPISLGDAIYSLRAIRRLKPDPIPEEDLRDILDAARQAPNGGNAQPWHFLVIKDEQLRWQFGELYREAWWAKRADQGIHGPADIDPANKTTMSAMKPSWSSPRRSREKRRAGFWVTRWTTCSRERSWRRRRRPTTRGKQP